MNREWFRFTGRIGRKSYFILGIQLFLIALVASSISLGLSAFHKGLGDIFIALVTIFYIACIISVSVRRMHDLNWSGWWQLIMFVPLVGFIIAMFLVFKKGTTGTNRFGPDPVPEALLSETIATNTKQS